MKLLPLLALTIVAMGSPLAFAQDTDADSNVQATTPNDARDDDPDLGWLGLLGLAGLLGLKRKDREPVVRTANRTM